MGMRDVQSGDSKGQHKSVQQAATARESELVPGQVVVSKKGRDQGRLYLLIEKESNGFVRVSDGMHRPIKRPKRKNPKHLAVIEHDVGEIAERLQAGRTVRDQEILEALARIESVMESEGIRSEEVEDLWGKRTSLK